MTVSTTTVDTAQALRALGTLVTVKPTKTVALDRVGEATPAPAAKLRGGE